ncbi:hypothetical protein L6164_000583 [Bauhinia variegata]|uniref:Uncharacterized protein n=1 Tax=Bauhinia variegata TaxID=167791 RepID=A0ACB9Q773_BAUVA|nr:hypothetical protein L6164_000583 [Bauhinia variegata]
MRNGQMFENFRRASLPLLRRFRISHRHAGGTRATATGPTTSALCRLSHTERMGFWTLLEGFLLFANALAILNEDRFLAPRGWTLAEVAGSGGRRNSPKELILPKTIPTLNWDSRREMRFQMKGCSLSQYPKTDAFAMGIIQG